MFGNHQHDHDRHAPGHDHGHRQHSDFQPGRGGRPMRGGPRSRPGGPFGAGFGPGFDPRGGFPLGGPGFGRGGRGGGRGRRAGRGDVRLGILTLLAEEPMHGYQIIQELAERSGGVWRPSPGSVYPTLAALEDEGLVRAEQSEGKRVFHLTEAGQGVVAESADRPKPWDEVANEADGTLVALRDQLFHVGSATMQVAQAGSKEQVAQAQKILGETRRKLYLLLAEDLPVDVPPTTATDAAPGDD